LDLEFHHAEDTVKERDDKPDNCHDDNGWYQRNHQVDDVGYQENDLIQERSNGRVDVHGCRCLHNKSSTGETESDNLYFRVREKLSSSFFYSFVLHNSQLYFCPI
jgi:hypothetical protein